MEQEFELKDEAKSYLPIDADTRLAITPRNWQLQKRYISKAEDSEGKITWSSFRYYTALESALKDIVHIKVAQESFKTAQGLVDANNKVIDELVKALSPIYQLIHV